MTDRSLRPAADALERRPDARAIKVEDLMADVRRGRVRVPSFQRGLKWVRKDALAFLDSIYRGYPVGTLLFWETYAEAGEVKYGSVVFSGDARPDALWVVDGQQRIVSLVRTLLARAVDQDGFALYFDLDEGDFKPPPPATKLVEDPSRWLPLTDVLDSERLHQWAFEHTQAMQMQRRERAFQVGKRLREYEIPAYFVRTADEGTLREIFERVNSRGTRLEASEVFDALHGSRTSTRPASILQIAEELSDLHFGVVEPKILYRLLRVLHGADVTDRAGEGPLRLAPAEAELAYAQTAAATRRVLQFLKDQVGIGHYELLPYKQPIVTLGKFFHHHPSPTPRSRVLLQRWLWRGALNGSHRGDTVSTRKALGRIDPQDEAASVQGMLKMVSQQPEAVPSVRDAFNFRHAAGKLLALAMMDLAPRHLATGEPIPLETLLDRGSDVELPFPQVLHTKNAAAGLLASAVNRLVHPAQPALRSMLMRNSDPAVLVSHGISQDAVAALRLGKTDQFLELRALFLSEHAHRFFSRQARWEESDRPALTALIVTDEGVE